MKVSMVDGGEGGAPSASPHLGVSRQLVGRGDFKGQRSGKQLATPQRSKGEVGKG